jgi:thiamine monophosphate kinase
LCRAAGLGAVVDAARLPADGTLSEAVAFGEDYGLCFAADPSARGAIESIGARHRVALTAIGNFTANADLLLAGHPRWPEAAFDHFRGVPR